MYTGFMEFFGLPSKTCYDVHRVNDITPVEGCEGMTESDLPNPSAMLLLCCVVNGALYFIQLYSLLCVRHTSQRIACSV